MLKNDLFDKTDNSVDNYTVGACSKDCFENLQHGCYELSLPAVKASKLVADPSGTQSHPVRLRGFRQRLEEAILHSQNTTPPCSLYPQLVKSCWQCGWTRNLKVLKNSMKKFLKETVQKQRILISLTCRAGWSRTSTLSSGTCALPVHLSTRTSLTEFSIT